MTDICYSPYWWNGEEFVEAGRRGCKHRINSFIDTENLWRITGYYIAKGRYNEEHGVWFSFDAFGGRRMNTLIYRLCLAGLHFLLDRTTNTDFKLILTDDYVSSFFQLFGKPTEDRRIPPELFELPIDLLRAVLEGYALGAGDYSATDTEDIMRLAPLNQGLAEDLQRIFQKVYGRPMELKPVGMTWILRGVMHEYEREE